MSSYSTTELLQKWKLGEVTETQMIGYLLQNLLAVEQRQADAEKRIQQLVQRLNAQV